MSTTNENDKPAIEEAPVTEVKKTTSTETETETVAEKKSEEKPVDKKEEKPVKKTKRKLGDIVSCNVVLKRNGKKQIVQAEDFDPKYLGLPEDTNPTKKLFEIIGIQSWDHVGLDPEYMVLISEDYSGWFISQFHIDHGVSIKEYYEKRFYSINEDFIL